MNVASCRPPAGCRRPHPGYERKPEHFLALAGTPAGRHLAG
jgi:hypothetical protein